jgi:hypothetical protein
MAQANTYILSEFRSLVSIFLTDKPDFGGWTCEKTETVRQAIQNVNAETGVVTLEIPFLRSILCENKTQSGQ